MVTMCYNVMYVTDSLSTERVFRVRTPSWNLELKKIVHCAAGICRIFEHAWAVMVGEIPW